MATYNVIYDDNGSTAGSVPTDATEYAEGASATVLANTGHLSLIGFSFNAWNTQAGGGGTAYVIGATITMPAADVTLYAQWVDCAGEYIALQKQAVALNIWSWELAGSAAKAYYDASEALRNFCFGADGYSGPLSEDNLDETYVFSSSTERAAFLALWNTYQNAKADMVDAIEMQNAANEKAEAIATAASQVNSNTPHYLGYFDEDHIPATPNEGDYFFYTGATLILTHNTMYIYASLSWVEDTSSAHIFGALSDLIDPLKADAADQASVVTFFENLVAVNAFIENLLVQALRLQLGGSFSSGDGHLKLHDTVSGTGEPDGLVAALVDQASTFSHNDKVMTYGMVNYNPGTGPVDYPGIAFGRRVSVVKSCAIVEGNYIIHTADTSDLGVGVSVTGSGIPNGCSVAVIPDSTHFHLGYSTPTATGTVDLTFTGWDTDGFLYSDDDGALTLIGKHGQSIGLSAIENRISVETILFRPQTDNVQDLGDATHRYKNAFLSGYIDCYYTNTGATGIAEKTSVATDTTFTLKKPISALIKTSDDEKEVSLYINSNGWILVKSTFSESGEIVSLGVGQYDLYAPSGATATLRAIGAYGSADGTDIWT